MNCRQADKWIDQALDGALAPGRKALLDAHLAACAQCRKEWEVLQVADAALRAPRPVRAPHGLLTEFRERVAQEDAQRERRAEAGARQRAWPWFWPSLSFAAATATAALVIAFNVAPPGSPLSNGRSEAPRVMASGPTRDPEIVPPPRGAPAPAPVGPAVRENPKPPSAAAALPALPKIPAIEATVKPPKPPATSLAFGRRTPGGGGRESLDVKPPRPDGDRMPSGLAAAGPPTAPRMPRLEMGVAGTPVPERLAGNLESRVARRDLTRGIPIALEADVHLALSEVLPPEFNVSPAVLTALRRDVEVNVATVPVREALRQITETADVVVKIDPSVQPLRVTVEQEGQPLWVALQHVAQQGRLEIVPEENHLVLRPLKVLAREDVPGIPRRKLATEPPGKKKSVDNGFERSRIAGESPPDRDVWPATWGTLPERGFEPPGPQDLPPAVAGLPQAMDEARLENRSYQQRFNLEPNGPASGGGLGGSPAPPRKPELKRNNR